MAAFVALVIVSVVKHQKVMVWISSIALGVLFLFGAVIPFWNFFKWVFLFLLVAGAVFGITMFVSNAIKKSIVKRREALSTKLKNTIDIPMPDDAVFDSSTEKAARHAMSVIPDLEQSIAQHKGTAEEWKYRKLLTEEKLRLFYTVSLKAESRNCPECYTDFENKYNLAVSSNDISILRVDDDERMILNNTQTKTEEVLEMWFNALKHDKTHDYSRRISNIRKMDTSGLFGMTSSGKISEQTRALTGVVNDAISEANELGSISEHVNKALTFVRLCAYRNIYLGVELLNYIRDNGGGSKLKTQKDFIDIGGVKLSSIELSIDTLTFNIESVISIANRGYDVAMDAIRGLGFRPGAVTSVAVGGLAAIGAGLLENASKVAANREQQAHVTETLDYIIPIIQNGQAGLLRTLEVMKAIVNANNGFMTVYSPLRDSVFKTGRFTQEDIRSLAEVTSAYNKICTTQL